MTDRLAAANKAHSLYEAQSTRRLAQRCKRYRPVTVINRQPFDSPCERPVPFHFTTTHRNLTGLCPYCSACAGARRVDCRVDVEVFFWGGVVQASTPQLLHNLTCPWPCSACAGARAPCGSPACRDGPGTRYGHKGERYGRKGGRYGRKYGCYRHKGGRCGRKGGRYRHKGGRYGRTGGRYGRTGGRYGRNGGRYGRNGGRYGRNGGRYGRTW
eukprot:1178663-Prorocentrum_minimum.AAC.4